MTSKFRLTKHYYQKQNFLREPKQLMFLFYTAVCIYVFNYLHGFMQKQKGNRDTLGTVIKFC